MDIVRKHMFTALDALVRREKDLSFKLSRRLPKTTRSFLASDLTETKEAIAHIAELVGVSRDRDEAWFFDPQLENR